MKAILEFNLPEEQCEFDSATKGSDAISCLCEIRELFRRRVKYAELSDDVYKECEKMYEEFWDIVNDHELGNEL